MTTCRPCQPPAAGPATRSADPLQSASLKSGSTRTGERPLASITRIKCSMPNKKVQRSQWQAIAAALLLSFGVVASVVILQVKEPQAQDITVYMSPHCGCCGEWVDHLAKSGFSAQRRLVDDLDVVKARQQVPAAVASCHTAVVDGYFIEGHVPGPTSGGFSASGPRPAGSPHWGCRQALRVWKALGASRMTCSWSTKVGGRRCLPGTDFRCGCRQALGA